MAYTGGTRNAKRSPTGRPTCLKGIIALLSAIMWLFRNDRDRSSLISVGAHYAFLRTVPCARIISGLRRARFLSTHIGDVLSGLRRSRGIIGPLLHSQVANMIWFRPQLSDIEFQILYETLNYVSTFRKIYRRLRSDLFDFNWPFWIIFVIVRRSDFVVSLMPIW